MSTKRKYDRLIGVLLFFILITTIIVYVFFKVKMDMKLPKHNAEKVELDSANNIHELQLQQTEQELQMKEASISHNMGSQSKNINHNGLKAAMASSTFDYNSMLQFSVTWDKRQKILNSISRFQIYLLLKNQMTKLNSLDEDLQIINNRNEYKAKEKISVDLSELQFSDFGTMYLFDLFGDSCSHGDKVYDVVKEILNDYKLDSVINKIVLRPVNYFSNINLGDSLFYEYYKTYVDPDYTGGKKNLVIDTNSLIKKIDETPTIYLESIYTSAIDKKPDIISSSYKGTCGFSYIEKSLSDDNDYTNYLTAALNDSLDIDKIKLKDRIGGETYSIIEPIASYFQDTDERGTIIVGNQVNANTYEGMYSSSGNFITALGKGSRWGKVNCTKCIDSAKDVGTSFATPEVATKLLIAKAWWRKHNADCNAIEARRRLVLATNLNDNFLGRFASAGEISLNKLLQTAKGYLVKNNDDIIPIDSIYTSIIANGNILTRLKVSTNLEDMSGLYLINGKVAGLKNRKSPKWELISEPTSIDLTIKRKSDQVIVPITKEDFYRNYKQFVILK